MIRLPSRVTLRRFIQSNKWIILAVAFFILWKIFLTYTLWEGRSQPPEWDDSYGYIDHIYSVVSCPSLLFCQDSTYNFSTYAGFDHLTYRLFWGSLARLIGVDAMTIFHWGFYLSIPMLVAALLFFLRRLTDNKNLIALSLFVLALYNGAGSYHGFFWVVPSFFAVVFFFILSGVLLDREENWRRWAPWIFLLVPLAVFTHIIGLYAILLLFPAFAILKSLFRRNLDKLLLKKVVFSALVALVFYLPVYAHVSRNVPYGPQAVAREIGVREVTAAPGEPALPKIFETKVYKEVRLIEVLPGLRRVYFDYIEWVFRNLPATLLFTVVILLLLAKREYTVLALYAASLAFALFSTVNQYGFRALALLWPVTFLLYAYGAWAAFQIIPTFLRKRWRVLGRMTIAAAFAGFLVFNVGYSLYWNETENRDKNFQISEEAISFIYEQEPEKIVALDTLIPIYLRFKRYPSVTLVESLADADYFCGVILENDPAPRSRPATLFQRFFTSGAVTESNNKEEGLTGLPEQFVVAETFENVVCYRNTARM